MNIQSGQTRMVRASGRGVSAKLLPKMWFVTKAACFCVAVAALLNGHIYLRQKITETERDIRRTERSIVNTRRELEQLRNDYAELTRWTYIRRQIARFKLPLESPRPGQVRSIKLYSPTQVARLTAAEEAGNRVRLAVR